MHSLWALQLLSKKKGGKLHLDIPSPVSQVLMKDTSESQQKLGMEGGQKPESAPLQMGWSSLPHPSCMDSNRCRSLPLIFYMPPHTQG